MPENDTSSEIELLRNIKNLKNKRAYFKKHLTILQHYLDEAEPDNLNVIKKQLEICERADETFNSLLEENFDIDNESQFDEFFNEKLVTDTFFGKLKGRIDILLCSSPDQECSPAVSLNSAGRQLVRLPKIKLPSFSGKYEEWLSFRDSFHSLIESNNSLTKIEKFQYLKGAVVDEASAVIKCLEITEDNYEQAKELLKNRYENKRVIVNNHIKAFFELPAFTKESHSNFRNMLDAILQHTRALKSMGRPLEGYDDILIYLITSKFPLVTRKEWEDKGSISELPTLTMLTDFLLHKCHTLEAVQATEVNKSSSSFHTKRYAGDVSCLMNTRINCTFCNKTDHFSNQCPQFLSLSINDRIGKAREKRLCLNCLKGGHKTKYCKRSRCRKCQGMHNTVLHLDISGNDDQGPHRTNSSSNVEPPIIVNVEASSLQLANTPHIPSNIILSTCLIEIRNGQGNYINARAILDSGSQINVMSNKLLNRLGLKPRKVNLSIVGIGDNYAKSNSLVSAKIKSKRRNFTIDLNFYILDRVTNYTPSPLLNTKELKIPEGIELADPDFFESREIDLLIGAETFYELLLEGLIRTQHKGVILKKSVFGWILSGSLSESNNKTCASCNLNTLQELNVNILKFWEIEQLSSSQIRSFEEQECENHFQNTITQNENGRFVASLPWKASPFKLGDSFEIAIKRFYRLERKLLDNPIAKKEYDNFLMEYLNLNHMREIGSIKNIELSGYFLPHHAVYKADSLTTKTRVVFDASAKTNSGISLNDILMNGPVIQSDLFSILLRFRTHKYILTADITKMYRQILIKPEEVKFQKILYRFNVHEQIKVYELLTLTYGIRPASFIATRCLNHLASQIKNDPTISQIIAEDFYVDDLITGSDDKLELKNSQRKVSNLLKRVGFELRKWASNDIDVIDGILSTDVKNLVLDRESGLKTLGVGWHPANDLLLYNANYDIPNSIISKRLVLRHISQLFDPLGLVGPVVVVAKLIMQDLWKLQIGWDEPLPDKTKERWLEFSGHLKEIALLNIPRCVIQNKNSNCELHGFADASEKAYGACVYVREISLNKVLGCRLLCAKSRIAPLKTLSLPRLELCAALLLAELMSKVVDSVKKSFSRIFYYSDSTIALAWIKGCPSKWKTFVAHRVAEIQAKSDPRSWFYVKGTDNPADIISRGSIPSELLSNAIWWKGPNFLLDISFEPLHNQTENLLIPEAKVFLMQKAKISSTFSKFIFNKFSSLCTLLRVISFCRRFINNCRHKSNKTTGSLSVNEIKDSEMCLIRLVQQEVFHLELVRLQNSKPLHKKSNLLSLNPFLDRGILRVGGRLRHSNLSDSRKFPILLPKSHPFTYLIIRNEHIKSLHGGTQITLSLVRLRYWPIHGRSTTQKIIRKCVSCFRNNPTHFKYMMADLPASRLQIDRPFSKTGIDFFGPFFIKEGGRRSKKRVKMYGCVFLCMLTKAIHSEVVEDLSTEAFVAALKRFISRRGLITEIFCDNATNFVGARNELRKIYQFLKNDKINEIISNELSNYRIKWNFNPPRAPHFGGLWEAAVKSFKGHLYKMMSNASLTLIEFQTLLIQIEGILNCRPLTPLSSDPTDLDYLTPGHFLIGDHLQSVPEVDIRDQLVNRLSRWQRIQQLYQQFWKRWSRDYLQELQKRHKWRQTDGTLCVGQLVLIQEDNIPPRKWNLGRIKMVHPGPDQVVRTATIITTHGEIKRPAVKLCVLPID